jgi:rubrerythrin
MGMIENLDAIRTHGMDCFLREQAEKYRCPACGSIFGVHRNECPSCKALAWQ